MQPARVRQPGVELPRILCVDDERHVLSGLSDTLRRHYEVTIAEGGHEGLQALSERGPFAVVMSDFMMPGMNGAQFLAQARILAPDTVRILLTGQTTLDGAIAAVNDGNIFRFLTKPCPPETLLRTLEDAIDQARLVTADRKLLERKLEAMTGHLLRAERLASIGTMAGAVGHELNRLLASFAGALEQLRRQAGDGKPPGTEPLATLDRVADHLKKHAANLLHFGSPARDGAAGVATDLCRAVGDALGMLRSAGILRHVQLELDVPVTPVWVAASGGEIEQVLVNFVKNAVEAVENVRQREPTVEISVEPGADTAVCTIRDNGVGIARPNLPLIFEPYFTTKPADRGTGLGLFVVRKIVESRQGEVSVTSEEGRGTTFKVTLPTAPAISTN